MGNQRVGGIHARQISLGRDADGRFARVWKLASSCFDKVTNHLAGFALCDVRLFEFGLPDRNPTGCVASSHLSHGFGPSGAKSLDLKQVLDTEPNESAGLYRLAVSRHRECPLAIRDRATEKSKADVFWVSCTTEGHLCDSRVNKISRQLEDPLRKRESTHLLGGPSRPLGTRATPREFESAGCIRGHQSPRSAAASRKITSL
jgi:hypothetical protein